MEKKRMNGINKIYESYLACLTPGPRRWLQQPVGQSGQQNTQRCDILELQKINTYNFNPALKHLPKINIICSCYLPFIKKRFINSSAYRTNTYSL